MRLSAQQVAVGGLMTAITIFLGITRLGFIPFFGIAITILHLPVILGAILEGPIIGTIIGFLFGLFSLIQANIAPTGPGDLFFRNPLVSIFPRLFIGLVAWAIYIIARPLGEIVALGLAGAAGTLTNTLLVLGILVGLKYIPPSIALAVAVTNAPLELVAAVIITVAVVATWKRLELGRRRADL